VTAGLELSGTATSGLSPSLELQQELAGELVRVGAFTGRNFLDSVIFNLPTLESLLREKHGRSGKPLRPVTNKIYSQFSRYCTSTS